MTHPEKLRKEIQNGKPLSRKRFETLLHKYCPGATYEAEWQGRSFVVHIDSPKGFIFGANLCHCIKVEFYSGKIPEILRSAAMDVVFGLEKCEDAECEICHDELS